jgi:hypothetical protein
MGSGNELTRVGFKAQPVDKDDRLAFVAAATTIGFELCEGTPKVSNVYDQGHPFEPGQPGDVRMYLPQLANDININEFIEVWNDPEAAFRSAEAFPQRIKGAKDGQKLVEIVHAFQPVYLSAVVAHMKELSRGRIAVPDVWEIGKEEQYGIDTLDKFEATHLESAIEQKDRNRAASVMIRCWRPAMFGWLKAYRQNRLELSNLWQDVPQAIRIKRGHGLPPLVLERGPKFKELLERWT